MGRTKSTAIKAEDMVVNKAPALTDLDLPTLHTVADYFGVEEEDTIEEQVLSLAENGVTYALYAKEFNVPYEAADEESAIAELPEVEETVPVTDGPVTAERNPALAPQAEYLIKMTRQNPYFEVASVLNPRQLFKFTQEHPYAIMDARTAQHVLQNEIGFRQAFPDELRDFYED